MGNWCSKATEEDVSSSYASLREASEKDELIGPVKIAIVGDRNAGKTSIIRRCLGEPYLNSYVNMTRNVYTERIKKKLPYKTKIKQYPVNVDLQLIDVPGRSPDMQEEYRVSNETYTDTLSSVLSNLDAVIVVMNASQEDALATFHYHKDWFQRNHQNLRVEAGHEIPFFGILNKADEQCDKLSIDKLGRLIIDIDDQTLYDKFSSFMKVMDVNGLDNNWYLVSAQILDGQAAINTIITIADKTNQFLKMHAAPAEIAINVEPPTVSEVSSSMNSIETILRE